ATRSLEVRFRNGGPQLRVSSPLSARSTLITSAPKSAISCVHQGPASTRERSSTRMLSSGLCIDSVISSPVCLYHAHSIRYCEILDSSSSYTFCESMNIRKLRYFVAVAEELSFTRAAQRLRISQPPLSTQIRELEEALGVTLLERTRRAVKLTGPGQVFLEKSRFVLEQLDAAVSSTQRASVGGPAIVRLGLVGSALFSAVPSMVDRMRRSFTNLHISFFEFGSSEQIVA